jgi:hypothetical protein
LVNGLIIEKDRLIGLLAEDCNSPKLNEFKGGDVGLLPTNYHSGRRTFITKLADKGVGVRLFMGHWQGTSQLPQHNAILNSIPL